jgi:hypothetical protein
VKVNKHLLKAAEHAEAAITKYEGKIGKTLDEERKKKLYQKIIDSCELASEDYQKVSKSCVELSNMSVEYEKLFKQVKVGKKKNTDKFQKYKNKALSYKNDIKKYESKIVEYNNKASHYEKLQTKSTTGPTTETTIQEQEPQQQQQQHQQQQQQQQQQHQQQQHQQHQQQQHQQQQHQQQQHQQQYQQLQLQQQNTNLSNIMLQLKQIEIELQQKIEQEKTQLHPHSSSRKYMKYRINYDI